MQRKLLNVLVSDDGSTLVEYGIVILFIAVVSIAILKALGPKVATLFAPVAPAL